MSTATEPVHTFKAERDSLEDVIMEDSEKPKLVWFSIWRRIVYVSMESYIVKMVECANVNYIFSDLNGIGGTKVTPNDLLLRSDAYVAVYSPDRVKNMNDLLETETKPSEIKVVKNGKIYRISEGYWQPRLLHTDAVVNLAAMCHSGKFKDCKPMFSVKFEK